MGIRRSGFIALMAGIVVVAALVATTLVVNMRALAAGAGSGTQPVQTVASAGPSNTLTVVGQGEAIATPDTATVTLGAQATRANVHDALVADNADMGKLLNALHAQGVVDKDIQTTSVYVNQQTNCCPSTVYGYQAANSVTVTIHHLGNVGAVIEAVVTAVGNDVTLGGVNLSVADTSAAVSSARSAAMTNAAQRAGIWAGLAGRKLGKLLSLSEVVSSGGGQGPCSGGCGAGGGGVPIQAGQSQITVSVTATYALSD